LSWLFGTWTAARAGAARRDGARSCRERAVAGQPPLGAHSLPEAEVVTVKEIAAQTGMSVQTVRRRLRLRSLTPVLRAAFDRGKITASLAEAAARLPDACQRELGGQLEAGCRLSVADVRDVARSRTAAATGELPGGLFAEAEVAWQVTVRGHLTAALRAIPVEGGYGELGRVTRDALAQLERVDAEDET